MFTGLIEALGEVSELERTASGFRLRLRTTLAPDVTLGDSLAVNGVCLTVATAADGDVAMDVGPETARVTTLGLLRRGQRVNLERAMRTDGRFGGHFVLGHVDGTGRIDDIRQSGDAHMLTVSFDPPLARYLVSKGSVAVDGISLTVAALRDNTFEVMIVPQTWTHTTLGVAHVGDPVNLECDIIGKYVVRALEVAERQAPTSAVTAGGTS